MMNIKGKKAFIISMAVIGCLIFNSNLKLAAITINGSTQLGSFQIGSFFSAFFSTVGDKLASPAVTTSNLLTDALSSRMTSVKGCLANPFVHAIYSHSQNSIDSKCGYKDDVYGLILGTDHVWAFANEKYFHLGTAFGYMNETPTYFGSSGEIMAEDFDTNFKQDIGAVRLFGAYESFDDKCLKTNFGVILGYTFGYNYDKDKSTFQSHNISLRVESIQNLYAYNGYQFGLWLQSDYNCILQYIRYTLSEKVNFGFVHSFLTTVVGLNIEKEVFEHVDKKLTLSLKTGWECRVIQHTNVDFNFVFYSIDVDGLFKFKYPLRNAAIVSFRALQKLNNHWNIVGSYSARFNKNISIHDLSCGIEYAF